MQRIRNERVEEFGKLVKKRILKRIKKFYKIKFTEKKILEMNLKIDILS